MHKEEVSENKVSPMASSPPTSPFKDDSADFLCFDSCMLYSLYDECLADYDQ